MIHPHNHQIGASRIEQLRTPYAAGAEAPNRDDRVCLGESGRETCLVRVGCSRYQSATLQSTDFVRVEDLTNGGCEHFSPLVPSRFSQLIEDHR